MISTSRRKETPLGSLVNKFVFPAVVPPVAVILFPGGGGEPVFVWREIPTPDYDARRGFSTTRRQPQKRRKPRIVAKPRIVESEFVWEPDAICARAIARLNRRLERQRERVQNLVESDEEFLIITGQL